MGAWISTPLLAVQQGRVYWHVAVILLRVGTLTGRHASPASGSPPRCTAPAMRARQPALHAGSIGAPDAWCPARAPLHRCAGRGRGQGEKERGTNAVPAPCAAWRLAASGRRAAGWLATASGEKAAAERGNTMSADPSISTRSASIALSGLQLAGSAAAAVYALENFSTGRKKNELEFRISHFTFVSARSRTGVKEVSFPF